MRIALWHDLPTGGALRALTEQARGLLRNGHDVRIWTPGTVLPPETAELGDLAPHVRIRTISDWPSPSALDTRLGVPLDLQRDRIASLAGHVHLVAAEMRSWNADVLLAHPSWCLYPPPLTDAWTGPSLLLLHEPNRRLYEVMPGDHALPAMPGRSLKGRVGDRLRAQRGDRLKRLLVEYELKYARSFDVLLTNSLFSRESMLRAYAVDAHVIPLGIDHGAFAQAGDVRKESYVVSLGELGAHKNPMLAIEAIATIPTEKRPALRWFGNRAPPIYLRDIEQFAQKLGVTFEFRTGTNDATLAAQLAGAACFLFTAQLEPFGLSPLEANLAGTAVVAVAEGGVRETIVRGVNGALVDSRDPSALGRAVMQFTSDLSHAHEAGARAREHVRTRFTWSESCARLEGELTTAIERAARRHR